MILRAIGVVLILSGLASLSIAQNACRKVTDNSHILISEKALNDLKVLHLSRTDILKAIEAASIPETHGCWGSATGNFDGQIVSVGILQWNYGQKTLQLLLRRYRASFPNQAQFSSQIKQLMPEYGEKIFRDECLRDNLTKECLDFLSEQQGNHNQLTDEFRRELNALFESDLMTQIQVDSFVTQLSALKTHLQWLFPSPQFAITPLRVKWAIDLKVQQGGFPNNTDIQRIRKTWTFADTNKRKSIIAGVLTWYQGLCNSYDQDGVRYDCGYNIKRWSELNKNGQINDEAADLILMTYLRSRTAVAKSGLYQADTFQRRAKIAVGQGSVHGMKNE